MHLFGSLPTPSVHLCARHCLLSAVPVDASCSNPCCSHACLSAEQLGLVQAEHLWSAAAVEYALLPWAPGAPELCDSGCSAKPGPIPSPRQQVNPLSKDASFYHLSSGFVFLSGFPPWRFPKDVFIGPQPTCCSCIKLQRNRDAGFVLVQPEIQAHYLVIEFLLYI